MALNGLYWLEADRTVSKSPTAELGAIAPGRPHPPWIDLLAVTPPSLLPLLHLCHLTVNPSVTAFPFLPPDYLRSASPTLLLRSIQFEYPQQSSVSVRQLSNLRDSSSFDPGIPVSSRWSVVHPSSISPSRIMVESLMRLGHDGAEKCSGSVCVIHEISVYTPVNRDSALLFTTNLI